jgi:hypothetical protein
LKENFVAADRTYTAAQVALASKELREAAGADEEYFTGEQVVSMLSGEIRLLRERGFTDQHIADLFTGFDIDVSTNDIASNDADGTELR